LNQSRTPEFLNQSRTPEFLSFAEQKKISSHRFIKQHSGTS
jgi:hypothetical protein